MPGPLLELQVQVLLVFGRPPLLSNKLPLKGLTPPFCDLSNPQWQIPEQQGEAQERVTIIVW